MGNGERDKKNTLIVHAITKLDLGGAQKIVLSILKHLNDRGYKTLLICGEGGKLFSLFEETGIDMLVINELKRSINPFYDILALIKITRILKRLNKANDNIIVHTHTPKAGIIVRLSAYFAGIKKIYHTIHGWGFHEGQKRISRFIFITIERIAANKTKKLIAVSEYVRETGLQYAIGDNKKYMVIKNGIVKKRKINKRSVYDKYGIPPSKKIILQVSSLKPAKSPLDFLKVAYELKHRKELIFVIAGGGELKERLKKHMTEMSITNTLLLGWVDNTDELYNIADICTLTSISEGMPLVILEAISNKIPIVATDIPSIKEILNDYKYLCPPHDIKCFARNIEQLILKPEITYNVYAPNENKMLREYEQLY